MPVYTRPHKRKLAKRSRTRPVYGEGTDEGKYFRCWNCGWICNVDRDELGDSDSSAGDEHTDFHEGHLYSTYDVYKDGNEGALGPELITNGTFASDVSWTKGTGWTIAGNEADCDGTQVLLTELYQDPASPFEVGKTYRIIYTVSGWAAGSIKAYIGAGDTGTVESGAFYEAVGTYTEYLKYTNTGYSEVRFQADDAFVGNIDDVSLKHIELSPRAASRYAVLGGDTGHHHVALNIVTPDGEAELIRHKYTSDISSGCPFCGSKNYRGDY